MGIVRTPLCTMDRSTVARRSVPGTVSGYRPSTPERWLSSSAQTEFSVYFTATFKTNLPGLRRCPTDCGGIFPQTTVTWLCNPSANRFETWHVLRVRASSQFISWNPAYRLQFFPCLERTPAPAERRMVIPRRRAGAHLAVSSDGEHGSTGIRSFEVLVVGGGCR